MNETHLATRRPSQDLFLSREPDTKAMATAAEVTAEVRPVALPPAGRSILKSPTKARSPGEGKRHLRYHPSVLVWDAAENEDAKEVMRLLKGKGASRSEKKAKKAAESPYTPDADLDVHMSNHEGVTLLHLLCFTGNAEGIRLLLQRGANPDLADREGWTPLHVAAASRQMNVFLALIEGGARMPPVCNELGRLGLSAVTDDKDMLAMCSRHHERRNAYHELSLGKPMMLLQTKCWTI